MVAQAVSLTVAEQHSPLPFVLPTLDLPAVYEAQRVVVLAATTHPAFVDFARGLARGWRELSAEALGEAG